MKSLRLRALEILEKDGSINSNEIDIKEVIQELNVNQIELEIQNEELREKEEILIEAQEELMLLFMNAPVGYLVLDKNYSIQKYNKHALEIFNFRSISKKSSFFSFFYKINLMNSFIDWTLNNDSNFFEIAIKPIQSDLKWIRLTHNVTKLNNNDMHLLSVIDVTEEREEKEKLHIFDSALEKLPVSIIITDKDGYITYVNKELSNSSGYSIDELIGVRPSVFSSGFTPEEEYMQLWETISNGNTWTGILKNLSKTKKTSWMAAAISPILDNNQNIINYIAVETNIDEKIKMEEKLKEQEDVMLIQARHAAMGEMISLIAHQWRQPLSVISTVATGIKLQKELNISCPDDEIKSLDAINTSAQYLSETIEDFKNFFKNNKKIVQTNGTKIVDKLKKLNSEILKNNYIEFDIDINSSLDIHTYENELLQVVINLINNAKDVLLERKELVVNPIISIKIYNKDTALVIEINDNAGGVSEEIIDKIFNPYFTTKHQSQGTGLGLYITKTLIDKHLRGSISVQNNEKGALFILNIPNLDSY